MELIYQRDEQTDKVLVNTANLDWLLSPENISYYFRGNSPLAVFVCDDYLGIYYHCVHLDGSDWVIRDFHRDDGFIGGGGLKFATPAQACEYLLDGNIEPEEYDLDFDDHYECGCCICCGCSCDEEHIHDAFDCVWD